MKDDELLHKWIEGTISEEELNVFKQRPEFESLSKTIQHADQLQVASIDESSMLNEILNQKKTLPTTTNIFSIKRLGSIAVAACLLFIIGYVAWPGDQLVRIEVAQGQKIHELLPDGSEVILNASSILSYSKKDWDSNRQVQLEGEAQFTVRKGSTFSVSSPNGTVEVLGTVFQVKDRGKNYVVSCTEGRVRVSNASNSERWILEKGAYVKLQQGRLIEESLIGAKNHHDWVDGISRFNNETLGFILSELERQYAIEINHENIDLNVKLSCNFKHDNLDLAMKAITLPLDLSYRIDQQTVYIY